MSGRASLLGAWKPAWAGLLLAVGCIGGPPRLPSHRLQSENFLLASDAPEMLPELAALAERYRAGLLATVPFLRERGSISVALLFEPHPWFEDGVQAFTLKIGEEARVVLSIEDWRTALAHELFHALSPRPRPWSQAIEEGLAAYFGEAVGPLADASRWWYSLHASGGVEGSALLGTKVGEDFPLRFVSFSLDQSSEAERPLQEWLAGEAGADGYILHSEEIRGLMFKVVSEVFASMPRERAFEVVSCPSSTLEFLRGIGVDDLDDLRALFADRVPRRPPEFFLYRAESYIFDVARDERFSSLTPEDLAARVILFLRDDQGDLKPTPVEATEDFQAVWRDAQVFKNWK